MTSSTMRTSELRALKVRLKTVWESGDYGLFARYLEKGAIEFLDRLAIQLLRADQSRICITRRQRTPGVARRPDGALDS